MDRFEEKLRTALTLDLIDPHRVLRDGRPAGVLVLFGHPENSLEPSLLLTKRTESLETHKGQYAFPGGSFDPDDHFELGLVTTALRETEEEVGIPRSLINVLGKLPNIWTPTGFLITPVLGILTKPIDLTPLVPNPDEIAEVFWVPLKTLLLPETYREEALTVGDVKYPIHVFQIDRHRVWGATGAIIKNLLDRLHSLV